MSKDPTNLPTDLSEMLSRVMANPEAMGMFSSLLGGMRTESAKSCDTCEEMREERCEKPVICKENDRHADRKRLLLALKPFLPPERRQALDRILMVSEALLLLKSEKRN